MDNGIPQPILKSGGGRNYFRVNDPCGRRRMHTQAGIGKASAGEKVLDERGVLNKGAFSGSYSGEAFVMH